MPLSLGRVLSALEVIRAINDGHSLAEVALFGRIGVVPAGIAIDFGSNVGWLDGVRGSVTPRGDEVCSLTSEDAAAAAIHDFAKASRPGWLELIPRGRAEAGFALPVEVLQCFAFANVLQGVSPQIVAFWDDLAALARSGDASAKLGIGRDAERLSYEFESTRLGLTPEWRSVESNLAGFDLLSRTSSGSDLRIEVKGSRAGLGGRAFVSRHEWEVACGPVDYSFHLWDLSGNVPRLAVVDKELVVQYAPLDGRGRWESFSFRFAAFRQFFRKSTSDGHFVQG